MSGNQSGSKHETTLHQKGMKTHSAEAPSGKFTKGGSVNDNATRSETAPTPKSLGPRDA